MNGNLGSFPTADPVSAQDMMRVLNEHGEAEVTVSIAGTFIDVYEVTYNSRREKIVLCVHPDDCVDVLRKLLRRASILNQVAECVAGEESEP